jgi:transposase
MGPCTSLVERVRLLTLFVSSLERKTNMTMIGIDISDEKFDAFVRVYGKPHHAEFKNNEGGRNQFHKWLRKLDCVNPQLYMEATGRYGENLAYWANRLGWQVFQINPRLIRKFAEAKLSYNKTDKLDALAILRFAETSEEGEIRLWQPKTDNQNELRDLQMEIAGVDKMIAQERGRLKCGLRSQSVKRCIEQNIQFLNEQKKRLRNQALEVIKQNVKLSKNFQILKSQKGIGDITAIFLLNKIDFERFQKGRQLVSFAGIAPIEFSSGKSVRRKEQISRVGHSSIRDALYFPAVSAMTHDPDLRRYAQHLEANGKPKKVIICSIMARLLQTSFALIRDQRTYEVRTPKIA